MVAKTAEKAKATTDGRRLVGSRSTWGAGSSRHELRSCWELGGIHSLGGIQKLRLFVCLPSQEGLNQYSDARSWFKAEAEVWSLAALAWQNIAILCLEEVTPADSKKRNAQGKCAVDEENLLACEAKLLDRAAWALGIGRASP